MKGSAPVGLTVAVVFTILKLAHVIAWPWLWVLAPFWIPLAVAFLMFALAGMLYVAVNAIENKQHKQAKARREVINRYTQQFKF